MSDTPHLEERPERRYLAVAATTSMDDEPGTIARGLGVLRARLAERGLAAAGPPFVRYLEIDMPATLRIEVCAPVGPGVDGDDAVQAGTVPAGCYAVLRHAGPPEELVEANARLQRWAELRGLAFDVRRQGAVSIWGARLETPIRDPGQPHEAQPRETEIAYRLASER